jgi:hypothetical protein
VNWELFRVLCRGVRSLVVQLPGWTGLANARVTIFGDVYQLPKDMQDAAREVGGW